MSNLFGSLIKIWDSIKPVSSRKTFLKRWEVVRLRNVYMLKHLPQVDRDTILKFLKICKTKIESHLKHNEVHPLNTIVSITRINHYFSLKV